MISFKFQLFLFISFFIPSTISLLGLPIGLPLLECHITCLLCSGPNSNQCITCLSGLLPLLGSCLCPDGKYFAPGLLSCLSCESSCVTCDGGTSSDCLSCQPGYNLYTGICYPPCASNQYFDTATRSCLSCYSFCQTCTGPSANQCSSCAGATLVGGACKCPSGQFLTPGGGCGICDGTCKECFGAANNQCTACATGMVLQNNQCKCLTGSYMTTSPLGCQACDSMCLGCSGPGPTSCMSCKNNLVLSAGECKCQGSTFYNSATSSCVACSSSCNTCFGPNDNQCLDCKNNLLFSSNSCGCTSGMYLDMSINTCKPCDSTCQECDGPTDSDCTACDTSSGLALSSGGQCQCIGGGCSCPPGTFYDSILETCKPCNPTCETCNGPSSNQCLSCRADYDSFNLPICECNPPGTSCSCPTRTYFSLGTGTCEPCHQTCAECSGPGSVDCDLCRNNLVDSSGSCECPPHMYLDASLFCFDCDMTCNECIGPLNNQCSSCKPSFLPLSGGLCECPLGQYFDLVAGGCSPCEGSCETCSGPDQSQCLSCSSSKTLDSGYCIDICSLSQYRGTDKSCQPCDSSCASCNGAGPNQCTSCTPPKTLTGNTCPDIDNGCYYQCATCLTISSTDCLTCKGNLVLVEVNTEDVGSCDSTCPTEYSYIVENSQNKCRKKIGLDNRLGHGSQLNEIELNFGRNITPFLDELQNSIEIALQFREEQTPVTYKYSLSPSAQKSDSLLLNLTFYGHLLPRNVLYITYNLPSKANDPQNSTIYVYRKVQTIRLNEFYGYSTGMKNYVNTAALISSITLSANQVFAWTSSMIFRSIHSIRSKVVEDMIGFFIFLNVDFTPNFIQFCDDGMNAFELIVPNPFLDLMEALDKNEEGKSDSRLLKHRVLMMRNKFRSRFLEEDNEDDDDGSPLDRNLESKLFLPNHGAAVTLLSCAGLVIIAIETLRFFLNKTKRFGKIKALLYKASSSISFNFLIGHILGEYQSFIFFSLLQVITSLKISKKSDYLNVSISLFFFVISLLCIPGVFYLLHITIKKLRAQQLAKKKGAEVPEDDFLERMEMLYESFKRDRYTDLLYTHLLVIRCFGFALVLLFMASMPLGQIIYLLVSTIGIISYLFYFKPLKKKHQQILTLFYEFLFLSVTTMTLILHIFNTIFLDDIETRSSICLIILTLATSMFALNLASLIFEAIEIKEKFFKKQNKIVPVSAIAANAILQARPSLPLLNNGSQTSNVSLQNEEIISEDINQSTCQRKDDKVGLSKTYKIVKYPPESEENEQENPKENEYNGQRKYELIITESDSPTKKIDESSLMLRMSEEHSQIGKKAQLSRLLANEKYIESNDSIATNENLLLSHLKFNKTGDSRILSSRDRESSMNKERVGNRIRKNFNKKGLDTEDQDILPIRLDEKDTLVSPKKFQTLHHDTSSIPIDKIKERIVSRQTEKLNVPEKRLESAGTVDSSQIGSLVYDDNVIVRNKRKSHKTQLKGSTSKY